MEVRVSKKFLKELSQLPKPERQRIEKFLFNDLPLLSSPSQIHNLAKLKGYDHYYKIRFGDYQVGLRIINDLIILERVMHRKDIYNYYP